MNQEVKMINGYKIKDEKARNDIDTLNNQVNTSNYIDDITVENIRRYDTDCYITTIPLQTENNELIQPHVEFDTITPWNHAINTFSTLTINASASIKVGTMTDYVTPILIGDGEILHNEEQFIDSDLDDNYVYIGITSNRTIKEYKVNNTNTQTMLNDGCIQVFNAYYKLLEQGTTSNLEGISVNNNDNITTDQHPRQCLGIKQDGTIIILTCDGRTGNDEGLTSEECQNILLEYNVYDAWNLDGGGSTGTIYKGSKINRNIDNNRSSERYIPYTLNFRKEIVNEELAKVNSRIGEEKKNTLNEIYETTIQNHSTELDEINLDTQLGSVIVGYGNNMINKPDYTGNGYFINLPHSNAKFNTLYNKQFFIPRDTHTIFQRRQTNGTFYDWEPIQTICGKINGEAYTIANSNTYESITLSDTDFIRNSSLIYLNNGNLKLSKHLSGKVINIRISGTATGTAGNKFISLGKNGERLGSFTSKFGIDNSSYSTGFFTEFTFIYDGTEENYYNIFFYGTQSDVFDRLKINISVE